MKGKVTPANAMEAYGTNRGIAALVLNLRDGWSASRPGHLILRELAQGIHSLRGWVGPGVDLGAVEKEIYVVHAENRSAIP
jgi:hypothetical protein